MVEIKAARKKAEETLEKLKSTQAQLIQSEKLASLGELTTGIAHEIQNPLNFVNNFSEVNKELLDEIQEERKKDPEASGGESPPVPTNFGRTGRTRNEQLVSELLTNIKENEEKVIHHGKRADAIVKSMLQHSRSGNGQMEPSDINAICDEYLRLAYNGLKARG